MRVCPHCHLLLADSETVCAHDGTATKTTALPSLAAGIEHKFRDPQPFAMGQTGCLRLATLAQSGERGLLKVIPLSGFEPTERVRLKRELRKQGRLAHDGLPRIIDGGEVGQDLWLFRDFLAGESLAQRIRRLSRLEPMHALLIAAQVASALDELQRNGLLHRDVKPGHVILQDGPHGMPVSKLIDAGVAARLPSGTVFDLVGTPAYVSPEQAAGKLVSFRSDLYALGCLLFEMLTGAPPFPGDDVKAVLEAHKNTPPPELDATLELPAAALTLLRALLSKDPRQRPFSAQQVRRTLEPLLPPGAPLPSLQSRAPSSAGGISAPPEGRPARASTPRVSRSSGAPPVPRGNGARKDAYASGAPTEEIDLADIELPGDTGPRTMQLSPDEIEELDPAAMMNAGQSTMQLDPADISVIESLRVSDEAAAAVSDAVAQDPDEDDEPAPVPVKVASAPVVARAIEPAPAAEPEAPAAIELPVQVAPVVAAASVPSESAAAPQGGRRSIDFDVESLFDDDVPQRAPQPSANTLLNEAAPTQLWRPKSDAPPAPGTASAESAAGPQSAQSYRPVEADPEGTVMAARPGQRRGLPWLWIGIGAAVVLALAVVFGRGSDDEPAASAASAGEPADPEPAAAVAEGEHAAADEPSAAAEPTAPTAQAAPAAEAPAQNPSAAPAAAEEPAAQAVPVEPAAQAAVQPAAAAPAAVAAPPAVAAPAQPAEAARAEPPAALSAAVASARLGPASGSKLVTPKGARADRVAKAEEFKQQGRVHYQAGRYREAATAYQNAADQDPSDAGAFAGVAASRLAAGDADAAIAAYSRAVRLQPTSSGFHAALGRAYLTRGDRPRARAAYEKALELNPENGAAKTALAQLK